MDPLTALSLAGNVIQFVDFASKLIAKGNELYKSADGVAAEHVDVKLAASDLRTLTSRLKHTSLIGSGVSGTQNEEQALSTLADRCGEIAQELLVVLTSLSGPAGQRKRWKSYRQALKTLWNKDKIEAIVQRLSAIRQQLEFHVIVQLRERIDTISLRQFQQLDATQNSTRILVQALTEGKDAFAAISSSHAVSMQALQISSNTILQEQQRTREDILDAIECQNKQFAALGANSTAAAYHALNTHPKEQDLLEMLYFQTIDDRHEDIVEAHRHTYEWIFDEKSVQNDVSLDGSFCEWLKTGKGIYWMSGKAGSGKSTLMKYIYNDTRTTTLLQEWAGDSPSATAGFFFWNSGSAMQKTQLGLIQSILYEVIKRRPELQSVLFPGPVRIEATLRWQNRSADQSIWSMNDLRRAFKLLLQQTDLKVCLFIDGLDEYDGAHADIISLIKDTFLSDAVKVCLSSRPYVMFEDAFTKCPKLRLQDLTGNDIRTYVRDELEYNSYFKQLSLDEPQKCAALVQAVVKKAFGVFLWVKLAVQSLTEGLTGSDEISDLFARLDELPRDLLDLYTYLLKNIKPVRYLAQASKLLLIVDTASKISTSSLSLLELALADSYVPGSNCGYEAARSTELSDAEIDSLVSKTDVKLQSRCFGLLESTEIGSTDAHRNGVPFTKDDPLRWWKSLSLRRKKKNVVRFMHQSVVDFLPLPSTQEVLRATVDPSFSPHACLMASALSCLKYGNPEYLPYEKERGDLKSWSRIQACMLQAIRVEYILNCARLAEQSTRQPQTLLLDELERVALSVTLDPDQRWYAETAVTSEIWQRRKHSTSAHWPSLKYFGSQQRPPIHEDTFLSLCVEAGLVLYVQTKLRK